MIGTPTVIELGERAPMLFPRSSLFDPQGYSLMLPETRALKAVELREVLDGVELRSNGLIGYLPLTSNIVLNLTPKFPIRSLWRMLEVADTDYGKVLPVLRSYQVANAAPPHQLLVKGFCHYLRKILSLGVARGYNQRTHSGHYKPKVNFGRTVASYLSRGDELNVSSDIFHFSNTLYVNSLLKAACLDFYRLVPRETKWDVERRLLNDALFALGRTQPNPMRFGDQSIAASLPTWLREEYGGALSTYAILLGYSKIGFSYEAQGTKMPSFLFAMDKIFESYVRNAFRTALKTLKIAVLDGNLTQNRGSLFKDNKQFPVQPDLIFRQRKVIIGMGEVKYKPSLHEHDRYQVIAHAIAIGAPKAILISPAAESDEAGLEYVGAITPGTKIYHYQLDISGQDLNGASDRMVKDIAELLEIAI